MDRGEIMPVTVLLATDTPGRCSALMKLMRSLGLSVRLAATGTEMLRLQSQVAPGLVLLATDLRDIHALDLCRRLRRESDVPVIVIGDSTGELDRILALELGADDFMARSCDEAEMSERVRAALRRGADVRIGGEACERLDFGAIVVDRNAHELIVNGERRELTPTEMDLMWALAERPREVLASEDLLQRIWGYPRGVRTRTLDVHIGRLRQKLGENGRNARHILTVRSVGYRFDPDPAD